jgi:hypothetical protein
MSNKYVDPIDSTWVATWLPYNDCIRVTHGLQFWDIELQTWNLHSHTIYTMTPDTKHTELPRVLKEIGILEWPQILDMYDIDEGMKSYE